MSYSKGDAQRPPPTTRQLSPKGLTQSRQRQHNKLIMARLAIYLKIHAPDCDSLRQQASCKILGTTRNRQHKATLSDNMKRHQDWLPCIIIKLVLFTLIAILSTENPIKITATTTNAINQTSATFPPRATPPEAPTKDELNKTATDQAGWLIMPESHNRQAPISVRYLSYSFGDRQAGPGLSLDENKQGEMFEQMELDQLIRMLTNHIGKLMMVRDIDGDDELTDEDSRSVVHSNDGGGRGTKNDARWLDRGLKRTKRDATEIEQRNPAFGSGNEIIDHEIDFVKIADGREVGQVLPQTGGGSQAHRTHMNLTQDSDTAGGGGGGVRSELTGQKSAHKRHKRTHSNSADSLHAAREMNHASRQQHQAATTTPMGLVDQLDMPDNNSPIGVSAEEPQVTSVSSDSVPSSTESPATTASVSPDEQPTPAATFKKRHSDGQQLVELGRDSLSAGLVEQSANQQAQDDPQMDAQAGIETTSGQALGGAQRMRGIRLSSSLKSRRPAKLMAAIKTAQRDRVIKEESVLPVVRTHDQSSGAFQIGSDQTLTFDQADVASTMRPTRDAESELASKRRQLKQLVKMLEDQNSVNDKVTRQTAERAQSSDLEQQTLSNTRAPSLLRSNAPYAPSASSPLDMFAPNNAMYANQPHNQQLAPAAAAPAHATNTDLTTNHSLNRLAADLLQTNRDRSSAFQQEHDRLSRMVLPTSLHESLNNRNKLLEENFYDLKKLYPKQFGSDTPSVNNLLDVGKRAKPRLSASGSRRFANFASATGQTIEPSRLELNPQLEQQYGYNLQHGLPAQTSSQSSFNQVLNYLRGGSPISMMGQQQNQAQQASAAPYVYNPQAAPALMSHYNSLISSGGNQQAAATSAPGAVAAATLLSQRALANMQPAYMISKQALPTYLPFGSTNRFGMAYTKPQGSTKRYMTASSSNNHRSVKQASSSYDEPSSQASTTMPLGSSTSSDPLWSDTQNQEDDYQQAPQTIQITAVPNGLVGNGLNGFNGFNGWNGGNVWGGGPWNGRQVLLVNRQPQVGSEWRQWALPIAIILALPLILGALFVPVFLKSVMFLIQILQMLGLLMPPHQLAGHLAGSHSSSSSSG